MPLLDFSKRKAQTLPVLNRRNVRSTSWIVFDRAKSYDKFPKNGRIRGQVPIFYLSSDKGALITRLLSYVYDPPLSELSRVSNTEWWRAFRGRKYRSRSSSSFHLSAAVIKTIIPRFRFLNETFSLFDEKDCLSDNISRLCPLFLFLRRNRVDTCSFRE